MIKKVLYFNIIQKWIIAIVILQMCLLKNKVHFF